MNNTHTQEADILALVLEHTGVVLPEKRQDAIRVIKQFLADSRKPKRVVFSPPSPEEVEDYANSIGHPMDGEAWCDAYAQKGWNVGKTKMKDWRAAVRNWKANNWHPVRSLPKGRDL